MDSTKCCWTHKAAGQIQNDTATVENSLGVFHAGLLIGFKSVSAGVGMQFSGANLTYSMWSLNKFNSQQCNTNAHAQNCMKIFTVALLILVKAAKNIYIYPLLVN